MAFVVGDMVICFAFAMVGSLFPVRPRGVFYEVWHVTHIVWREEKKNMIGSRCPMCELWR